MPGRDLSANDPELKALLEEARTIAVLGASVKPNRAAFGVMRYLQGQGYSCLPVTPMYPEVLGVPAVPTLAELPGPVDIIDVFRRSELLLAVAEEILALPWRPRLVFIQLGLRDDVAATRLMAAGIDVIQDQCLFTRHWQLIGFHKS